MKLTVGTGARMGGFALPTILLVSTVMIIILVASIGAAAASRVSLDSQYYNLLAKQAAQSGIARATECLASSGQTPQWSTSVQGRDLRPNSDCTGASVGGASAYVVGDGIGPNLNVRTKYSIEAPNGSGVGSILQVVGTTELVRTVSPYNVWRSYTQSLYHRIEAPQAVACPDGFISVPGDSRFGTSDFCVAKYETKNVGGKAASQASGAPYVNVTQTNAADAAKLACAGCGLITEAQWLTLAHNVTNVSSNWSGEAVGSGYLYSGHTDNSPASVLAASTDDSDGYNGTGNSSGNQRRTLTLSNGEVIWDMVGNATEWTSGQTTGGQPGASGFAWREWNAIGGTGSLSPNPFPVFGTPAASAWTSTNGLGRVYSSTSDATQRGFLRSGAFNYGSLFPGSAGVFLAYLGYAPTQTASNIGFRMTFVPLSETNCAAGFVTVPGNSMFGTNDFCAGKYETKDVSGTPTSQASSLPWVSIAQATATTTSYSACATCRMIGESEWLTIAHNLMNVPSNWTGGSVGSGTVYVGHTDNSPAARLAASSNDNDGYFGTGNASGNQRRTLRLSNGEVIWDFSGNVFEWTLGQITGAQPGASGYAWRDWNTVTNSTVLNPDPAPAFGNAAAASWNSTHGIGRIYSSTGEVGTRAFLRSGNWSDANAYGLFGLALSRATNTTHTDTGFRLVSIPN